MGDIDVTGYSVEATDGGIGKVDEATYEVGASFIVVDTGPWIFGKKVVLPAGLISNVDLTEEKVHVDSTKAEIKDAPEFDEATYKEASYRHKLGGYYGTRGGPA
ncbi:MAG TPA: PRC-barrel domain containing protein [Actinomycetota bacterium]|nr:PRC-barrel domain containing protein [Actinomycetota bacterium]